MEVCCPHCDATLALADSAAGKRALCPNCTVEFRVPELDGPSGWREPASPTGRPTDWVERNDGLGSLIRCPACDRTLAVDPSMAGQSIICPTCKRRMRVPTANESSAEAHPEVNPYGPAVFTTDLSGGIPSLPGTIPGMQTGTNYALPGAILTILGGLGTLVFGLSLLGVLIGVIGNKAPLDLGEFVVTLFWSGTSLAAHLLSFQGGIQMLRRRQLGWAKLGAFASLYPCGLCVFVQWPVAVWAIVILNREIAQFDFASPNAR